MQQVKDRMWSLLWCGFDPWPGIFHMLQVCSTLPHRKKLVGEKKKLTTRRATMIVEICQAIIWGNSRIQKGKGSAGKLKPHCLLFRSLNGVKGAEGKV